jgi:osmotically-inducible protein OsmY
MRRLLRPGLRLGTIAAAAAAAVATTVPTSVQAKEGLEGTDLWLQSRIEGRLSRDPALDPSDSLIVSAQKGQVEIGGIVASWREEKQAVHNAFQAGARSVVTQLTVRNDPAGSQRYLVYRRDPLA